MISPTLDRHSAKSYNGAMHDLLLHNDSIRPTSTHCLSAGQTGLLNGWGVFSTLRVRDGVLFAYERHWARLVRDAKLLRVPMPASSDWLHQRLLQLVETNKANNATLRLAIIRNKGGVFEDPNIDRPFDLIAFTTDLRKWGAAVRLGVVEQGRHAASPFAGTKVTSWCQNLTFYDRAHEQGYDEVVLLNEFGKVSECTSANIFATFGNRVVTPPLSSGCLPGITRQILLEEVNVAGYQVVEEDLELSRLGDADEVFITSSTRELLAVSFIKGITVQNSGNGRQVLQKAFTTYSEAYVKSHTVPTGLNVGS